MNKPSEINNQETIVIGYYPIRGKAQVPRLLCEFLSVKYIDKLFELQEWNKFKTEDAKNWEFSDLPFLVDGDFILTESFPICEYIIEKYGAEDLLGKGITDKAIVQMYLWTIDTMGSIISINCSKIPEQQKEQFKQSQWKSNVLPRLMKYEQYVRGDLWFLGYLTIIDFSMYELMRYMNMLFPGKEKYLPKLNLIKNQIENLPSIKEYQSSSRAIKQMDPSVLLKRFKQTG